MGYRGLVTPRSWIPRCVLHRHYIAIAIAIAIAILKDLSLYSPNMYVHIHYGPQICTVMEKFQLLCLPIKLPFRLEMRSPRCRECDQPGHYHTRNKEEGCRIAYRDRKYDLEPTRADALPRIFHMSPSISAVIDHFLREPPAGEVI